MTALTLTPNPGAGSVTLVVVATAAVSAITRTDANGARPVRTLPGLLPHAVGSFVLTDYEPAHGLVTYAVTGSTGTVLASASTTLTLASARLSSVVLPQFTAPLDLVTGYSSARATSATVHDVIDRPDPLVSLGVMRTRRGTLTVWAPDYAAARTIESVYARGEVALLRQREYPGLDMYHVASGDVSLTPQDQDTTVQRWQVVVEYTEIAPPSVALLGSLGWSFADVAADYATFTALPAVFATFTDLTVGPIS